MLLPKVRVLCLPDIDRPIGGVKQLYRHVEHLVALGWDAAVLSEFPGFRPSWFSSSAPSFSLSESFKSGDLDPEKTILILPETYLGVDLSAFHGINLSANARVVFNQNAYYSYGQVCNSTHSFLNDFYDNPKLLQILSVSEDTHSFLVSNLGISDSRLSRIVNAIEPCFRSDIPKSDVMHWMPRKNPDHVEAIFLGLRRSGLCYSSGWTGEPLVNLTHKEVSDKLNNSRLFLSFGHPEGFGLPIAEAMASGCWVVGYSGGGGGELFRYGASELVSFGDWSGFIAGIQHAFRLFAEQPRETKLRLDRQALAVQSLYSFDQEASSIRTAWIRISELFYRWVLSRT